MQRSSLVHTDHPTETKHYSSSTVENSGLVNTMASETQLTRGNFTGTQESMSS